MSACRFSLIYEGEREGLYALDAELQALVSKEAKALSKAGQRLSAAAVGRVGSGGNAPAPTTSKFMPGPHMVHCRATPCTFHSIGALLIGCTMRGTGSCRGC